MRSSLVRLLLALVAISASLSAGCFQTSTAGVASPAPADAGAVPSTQCANGSAECFALCGSPECALPDNSIPPFLDVPVIYYQPDGSTAGYGNATPGVSTTDPCAAVESASLAIRQRSCAPCHGPAPAPGLDSFNYVLDDMTLANHPDNEGDGKIMVVPGDPYNSFVYQRVATGLAGAGSGGMPPASTSLGQYLPPAAAAAVVYPTPADVSILYGWILNCINGADGGAYQATNGSGSFGAPADPADGGAPASGGAGGTAGQGGAGGTGGTAGKGGTAGGAAGKGGAGGAAGRN